MSDLSKNSDSDSGNRGTQQEFFISMKVAKVVVPFQQEFLTKECDVLNDSNDLPSRTKNPTPSKNL